MERPCPRREIPGMVMNVAPCVMITATAALSDMGVLVITRAGMSGDVVATAVAVVAETPVTLGQVRAEVATARRFEAFDAWHSSLLLEKPSTTNRTMSRSQSYWESQTHKWKSQFQPKDTLPRAHREASRRRYDGASAEGRLATPLLL